MPIDEVGNRYPVLITELLASLPLIILVRFDHVDIAFFCMEGYENAAAKDELGAQVLAHVFSITNIVGNTNL